jgi:transposase
MRYAQAVVLTVAQREELRAYARGRSVSVRLAQRARIVLLASEKRPDQEIGRTLGITRQKASRWRKRFLQLGIEGLKKDAPRPGRKREVSAAKIEEIVTRTLHGTPATATHWSVRRMATVSGVSRTTVARIWRAHGLKPHLLRSFKLSHDPQFLEKLEDVVGLYLSPPDQALVLSCDEKSQIQALDRTQPGLPLKTGPAGTMPHDYFRHGTTTLFAALNTLDGTIIGTCMKRHRHQEWLKFLRLLERETPSDKTLHLIVDNYATHKHPKVKTWLARHPRFHTHFTPTGASWLNMIERFFRDLTQNRLRRGVFHSLNDSLKAIHIHIEKHNDQPKPIIWTAKASDILEKVKRARQTHEKL